MRRRDEGEGEGKLGVADAGRSAAGAVDDFLILVAGCLLETWKWEGGEERDRSKGGVKGVVA